MREELLHQSTTDAASAMLGCDDHVKDEGAEGTIRQHACEGDEAIVGVIAQSDHQVGPREKVLHLLTRAVVRPPHIFVHSRRMARRDCQACTSSRPYGLL